MTLQRSQFEVMVGILFRVDTDKSFGGAHLRSDKIFSHLAKHYWWQRMQSGIAQWCRGCMVCASRQVSLAVRPPITPLPVASLFDQVGVDVVKLPKSYSGNQYAMVFVD